MAYIKRDIEDKILALSKEYSCILITGPRQVGKTTVLKQLMDINREYVRLDDLINDRSIVEMHFKHSINLCHKKITSVLECVEPQTQTQ